MLPTPSPNLQKRGEWKEQFQRDKTTGEEKKRGVKMEPETRVGGEGGNVEVLWNCLREELKWHTF